MLPDCLQFMHALPAGKLPVTGAVLTGNQLARADKQQSITDESASIKPQVSPGSLHASSQHDSY